MTKVIVQAAYENGVQIQHGVWNEPLTECVEYIYLLWHRPLGRIVRQTHAEHTAEFGWLLDDAENPKQPLPGVRRKFFEALACYDCQITYAGMPRQ